jgi:hypothetical protein
MNAQTDELDKHIMNVMAQISEAASKHDLAAIQQLTRKAAELQELKQQMAAIQQRIASLRGESAGSSVPAATVVKSGGIRELPIEVTDGMIRQNLLTLTPHIKSRKIKVGEELIIEALPSGDRFKTELVDKGNKLRARGEIARFYRDAKVKGGDYVLLTEVEPGRWTLKKAPPGQYGLSRLLGEYA